MKTAKFIKKRSAYSLIELLIVIMVIGIISTVSVVRYSASQKYVRAQQALNNTVEKIRNARNYAINSKLIHVDTDGDAANAEIENAYPESFSVKIDIDGSDNITANITAVDAEGNRMYDGQKESYTSPGDKYKITDATKPIIITYTAPFGDTLITENGVDKSETNIEVKTKDDFFCRKITVNKISGFVSISSC
jgi:prepilin-type N-terminal cleavage/methylation domain-containing protein